MMLTLRLLPVFLIACLLHGQEDRLDDREAQMERRVRERAEQMDKERAERLGRGEKGEGEGKEEEDLSNLTPEERLARSVRHNASAFCRFVPALKPQKLMPGQTGMLVVSAVFTGQAVMPSPAPLQMLGAPQQGFVTLGGLQMRPAENGRHAAAYVGRPVYDNYAIFELPVTVASDAQIGAKQAVGIDLQFDIYDGGSGQPIGRFIDRVNVEVEVGRVADPPVQGGFPGQGSDSVPAPDAPPAAAAVAASAAGSAPVTDHAPALAGQPVVPASTDAPPAASPQPAAATEPDWSTMQDDAGGMPWPLWVGGGVLLLGLVLLLARKR